MRAAPTRRLPLLLTVAAVVVAFDQLTKWWAVETLSDRTIDLVWTLRLHLVVNHAAAFSLGGGLGPILPGIALVAVALLLRIGSTTESTAGAVALGLILGGALGNLSDRAFRPGAGFFGGGVVDFIDLQWWPVFNVADIAIFVGGALVVLTGLREGKSA